MTNERDAIFGREDDLNAGVYEEDDRTVREFNVTAIDVEQEILPGVTFPMWTYNGQVPGPTIRVKEGDPPALRHFAGLGLLAGAPVILGGWIGILTQSPTLSALFLAIGVGALLQVIFDIGDLVRASGSLRAAPNLAGFGIGVLVMYATDLVIVL